MAYQALYRKYRPTTFNEVVGQETIIQTLKNAKAQDRVAHAYLFCGPRGTGKTTIAKIFARMLNCTSTEDNQPCGECENCKMALNGSHPDIIEIDAASNNGVEEVRNLIDRVKYAPMQGQYKIYIIDEVHMMTKSAFNALLKTIEEPPKHIVFIFATTEPNKVLPTIISRCQRFDFSKVSAKDIVQRLTTVCEQEKIQIDAEAISLIASLADGGMRDALSILDQCVAYCLSEIHIADVRKIYGVLTLDDIGQLFANLYHKDIEKLMTELQHISDQGMDLVRFTSDFISILKNSVIYDYSPTTTLMDDSAKELIQKYFVEAPMNFRLAVLDSLMDTYNKFQYASNVLDYIETGLLKTISQSYEEKSPVKQEISEMKTSEKSEQSYDSPSEKQVKSDENHTISYKQREKAPDLPSDVSRETSKQSEIKDSKIILEDMFLLQLLVGANKQERANDNKKYEQINQFTSDLTYMRPANLLNHTQIIASGDTYLLVAARSDVASKEINEYENTIGFQNFTEKLLGKEKKVFSMDVEQCNRVIQDFKVRMNNHTLPDPAEIVCEKKADDSDQMKEENPIQSIFSNVEVRED